MILKMEKSGLIKSLFTKQNLHKTILAIVLFITFTVSLILFLAKGTKRRIFIFPSATTGEFIVEYRNLTKKPVQGDVNLYIDELLLGSQIERTKQLFVSGTKVLSCFQRGKVLYLNLSDTLLAADDSVIDIKSGIQLLDKNIKKNFPKIETVEVFVNGKIAFEK